VRQLKNTAYSFVRGHSPYGELKIVSEMCKHFSETIFYSPHCSLVSRKKEARPGEGRAYEEKSNYEKEKTYCSNTTIQKNFEKNVIEK